MNPKRSRRLLLSSLVLAPLAVSACGTDPEEEFAEDKGALLIYSSQHKNVTDAWAQAFTDKIFVKTQVRGGKDSSMGHQIV